MTNLTKPDASTVKDPLSFLVRVYDALKELQAQSTSPVLFLGAQTGDPGAPPTGKVYAYTIGPAFYLRTATQQTLVAV